MESVSDAAKRVHNHNAAPQVTLWIELQDRPLDGDILGLDGHVRLAGHECAGVGTIRGKKDPTGEVYVQTCCSLWIIAGC